MTDDIWGPWIEHDGKGCPCVGLYIYCWHDRLGVDKDGILSQHTEGICPGGKSWDWSNAPEYIRVLRYRIRTPRALIELRELAENLPANPKVGEPT